MTRSAGTSGLTRPGSPPRSAIASRITARSTIAGTPVKSWRMTLAGMNGISASAAMPGRQAASASTSSGRTTSPPACRRTFSSRILSVTGARPRSIPRPVEARESVVVRKARAERRTSAERILVGHAVVPRRSIHSVRARVPRGAAVRASTDEPPGDAERRRTLEELEREGIELDPERPGQHRHGDAIHAHDHPHPHAHAEPGEHPIIGIVGAGAVGTALGVALARAAWPVAAVASRDPDRRARFRDLVPGARAFAEPNALLDEVELILLTVPDDAIAAVAGSLRLYVGPGPGPYQRAARRRGPRPGDGRRDADRLVPSRWSPSPTRSGPSRRCTARRSPSRATTQLVTLLGGDGRGDRAPSRSGSRRARSRPITPPRCWPRAASWRCSTRSPSSGGSPASTRRGARRLRAARRADAGQRRALGIRAALTGPITRGDVGTLEAHLRALEVHAPDVLPLYQAAARREIALAEARGVLAPEASDRLRRALAVRLQSPSDTVRLRPCSTASPRSTRPVPRRASFARRHARASGDLGLRAAAHVPGGDARRDGAAPRGPRPARQRCARAGAPSGRPAATAGARRPAATRGGDALGAHVAEAPPTAALAPPRRRGAAEERHRHLCRWHRHPIPGGVPELVVGQSPP